MAPLDQSERPHVLDRLHDHLGLLTAAIDRQAPVLLRKRDVRIVGSRLDERGHVVLIGQYSIGGTREFTRDDYLPDGDDGSSLVYQAQVLESLALEQTAVMQAVEALEATQFVLENPPDPYQ